MSPGAAHFGKYVAVFRISIRNQWAYAVETALNGLFLTIILFIFVNLWSTTYQSTHQQVLGGYTVRDIIWYLAVTEAIMMGSPRLVNRLSQEIKEGDIAYRLTRPLHYVGYYFADYVGEAAGRIVINLCVGGIVALIFVGLPPCNWLSLLVFVPVLAIALSLQFFMYMSVCLLLFWIEDGRGVELIVNRFVMILGGMMIPLPLFPSWLARICEWLPFQAVSYLPSTTFVGIHLGNMAHLVWLAVGWLVSFAALCFGMYRKGVRQLSVQGG